MLSDVDASPHVHHKRKAQTAHEAIVNGHNPFTWQG